MDEEIDEESIITVMRLMQFQNLLKPEKNSGLPGFES